jgi:Fe2+ transport system protein B
MDSFLLGTGISGKSFVPVFMTFAFNLTTEEIAAVRIAGEKAFPGDRSDL